MNNNPKIREKSSTFLKDAILNVATTESVTARQLLPRLRHCGAKVNVHQIQAVLDELTEEGKMFTTRSMKQTSYHTTIARAATRTTIRQSLIERIQALLSRLGKTETAQRLSHLLGIDLATVTSHLEFASMYGSIKAKNVGSLRLYHA